MPRLIQTMRLIATTIALAAASSAHAQETVTYTYDELGRVKTVTRTGGPTNGAVTTYTYDKASNRVNVKTTGAQNDNGNNGGATAQNQNFVVVPLNGYSLIFYNQ